MRSQDASAPPLSDARVLVICVARVLLFATFMSVAATVPLIKHDWELSAAATGAVVSSFTIGYAVSLFLFAWGADHYGAKRMVLVSAVMASVSSLAFGLFARDWTSAMLLYGLVGLAQGGVYTPLVMLLADEVERSRLGSAMGRLIASTSVGYATSLAAAGIGIALGGWQLAFVLTGLLPMIGGVILIIALKALPNRVHRRTDGIGLRDELVRHRESRLLFAGYTAHTWELLGMWAWAPAFLAASLTLKGADQSSASIWGANLSGVLHLAGAVAALTMGRLSDRIGRKPVLIALAASGAGLSMTIGWLLHAPSVVLVALAIAYAFVCIGDSPVLTTAISEVIRPGYLGAVLAWRSLAGFGAGALAPLGFGVVFDVASGIGADEVVSWGLGFAALGIGGALAMFSAIALRRV